MLYPCIRTAKPPVSAKHGGFLLAMYDIFVDDTALGGYRGCPGAPLVHPVIESDVTPPLGREVLL